MWLVLVGVAGAIVILLTIVLVTPVELELSAVKAAGNPAVRVQTSVRWLGSVLPNRRADAGPAKTRPKARGRQASIEWSSLKAVISSPGFMRRFVTFVSDELRLTRPRRFHLRARIGFDDPSETGMLLGWTHALRGLASSSAFVVRIDPDFSGEIAEGELRVQWLRSLASVLWPMARLGGWWVIHRRSL